jgi:hypothetical protein
VRPPGSSGVKSRWPCTPGYEAVLNNRRYNAMHPRPTLLHPRITLSQKMTASMDHEEGEGTHVCIALREGLLSWNRSPPRITAST